jgi:HD-like signal output (HDOD) protein
MATQPSKVSVIGKALKTLDKLPALSLTAGRLLGLLASRKVDLTHLSSVVEKDALLCGQILRTVNSARFARARTITSVRQAMVMLGLGHLRKIALSFTVTNLFANLRLPSCWSRTRFNLHSTATAILVEAITDAMPLPGASEGAFVAGMMHDLGKLIIAATFPQEYEAITTIASASGTPLIDCERSILGVDHSELSGLALTKWDIPESICRAVYHHHAPGENSNAPWLAAVIQKADQFVNHLGISVLPVSTELIPNPFEPYDMSAVLKRFEEEWKEASQLF